MTNITNQNVETAKRPVAKLHSGFVFAAIWARTTDKGTYYAATFERRYKDGEGEWHSTSSFNADDLPALAKLAFDAHSEINDLKAEDKAAKDA